MYREIDISRWPRRDHLLYFSAMDYPHFNICADADLSVFLPFLKERKLAFYRTILYIGCRAANSIESFRYRIDAGKVFLYDRVHPGITVMGPDDLFGYLNIDYEPDFTRFYRRAGEMIDTASRQPNLTGGGDRNDLLYITTIPWISFTSLVHPIHIHPADSIPRISWGKYREENGRVKLPVSVQVHHGLMDGIHIGSFFDEIQRYFDNPDYLYPGSV